MGDIEKEEKNHVELMGPKSKKEAKDWRKQEKQKQKAIWQTLEAHDDAESQ